MPDQERILDDIRILDLSQEVAGPFCTKLLAGLGAEVIKVEPPGGGDLARRLGPFVGSVPDLEHSALFLYLNTGKKSITLDLHSPTAAAIVHQLVRQCDILVESFTPGFMEQLGLGYAVLSQQHPGLIYTAVTPFGQSGPYSQYKGSELVVQALGALMHTIGLPGREPLKIGGYTGLYTTGMSAFSATMLALHVRDHQGYGQCVDVSAMETMTVAQIHASIQQQFGRTPTRRASTLMRAQDGWVHPGLERGIRADTWPQVCQLIGRPELSTEAKFATPEARREHQAELLAILEEWTTTQPKEAIYHTLQKLHSVAGYVATAADLFASAQLRQRGFWQTITHPQAGTARYPGAAFSMQGAVWQHAPAPLLGAHNEEIYCQRLGYSPADLAHLRGIGVI